MVFLKFTAPCGAARRSACRSVAPLVACAQHTVVLRAPARGAPSLVLRSTSSLTVVTPAAKPASELSVKERHAVVESLRRFATHGLAMRTANEQHCISESLWAQVLAFFKRSCLVQPLETFDGDSDRLRSFVSTCLRAAGGDASAVDALVAIVMPKLVRTAETHFAKQLAMARERRQGADLRQPHTWYPLARSLKRRILFHAGPTNSGKTYNALQALKGAWSGVYCGPLRLLALEVFESMNQDGVYCSLLTGQERRELPFARHASCTVEMLDVGTAVDVAVIDEIQMIGDDGRGASWTRALLGVPALEVHVCGDPASEPVVRRLCEITGDELEVISYARLTAMTPMKTSLEGDYGKIEEGDAVVAFSRKDIYSIRRMIERKTHHKCCVVYGSLPPETRSAQARLFNDPNSGYRVLVASDAIGMGLNLNIRRVVFHTMNKYNGQSVGPVQPAQVKQIAGRAGRRSSIYPEGFATSLHDPDLPYLHACMSAPTAPINAAGLFPNAEQLLAFAALLPRGTPLNAVINEFTNASQLDGPYFMCRSDDVAATAATLESYRDMLSMEQRAALCLVPVNLRNADVRHFFLRFLDQYTSGQPVRLKLQLPLNDASYLVHDMEALEAKASALDTYLWLAARLGKAGGNFPDVEEAVSKRASVSEMLETALAQLTEDTKEAMAWHVRKQKWSSAAKARRSGRAPEQSDTSSEGEEEGGLLPNVYAVTPPRMARPSKRITHARNAVLRRTQEAASAGISERTAQRLQQEMRREKLSRDERLRREAATGRGGRGDVSAVLQVASPPQVGQAAAPAAQQ